MAGSSLPEDLGDKASLLAAGAGDLPSSPPRNVDDDSLVTVEIDSFSTKPASSHSEQRTKSSGRGGTMSVVSSVAALVRGKSGASGYKELRSNSLSLSEDSKPASGASSAASYVTGNADGFYQQSSSSSSRNLAVPSLPTRNGYSRGYAFFSNGGGRSTYSNEKLEAQYPESHMLEDVLGADDQGEDEFDIESHLSLDSSLDSEPLSRRSGWFSHKCLFVYGLAGAFLSFSASIAFFGLMNFSAALFALVSTVYATIFAGCHFVRRTDSTPVYFSPYHRRYTYVYMAIAVAGVGVGTIGFVLTVLYAATNSEPLGPRSAWLAAVWALLTLKWSGQCLHRVYKWSQERAIVKSMLL